MKKKILITSALPYANGPLHFGHIAGAYLPADCYARFERLMGNDVLFISGSDEYGFAITINAELAKRSPKEHVDLYHALNKAFFDTLHLSFDHYSRTTWEGHKEPVQQFFLDLYNNGFIEEKVTDQLFSVQDNRFLADRYVVGTCPSCGFDPARGDECPSCGASFEATDLKNPRSRLTGAPLILRPTKHWFLMLDKFKERLTDWIGSRKWKPNVVNFIKKYVDDLHPRAITRDSNWGVPVPLPNTEGKVLYVWFDAPIGYISATQEWAKSIGDEERWKDYWLDPNTTLVNFVGKDNIPFHAVIFPAMVMGQNLPLKLVDELPANEFLNLEGRQFSKSDGWYIDLERFFQHYSADQIRYTLAANAPETSDAEFTWKDFENRCNTDLVGKFGNLVNRTMTFIHKHAKGEVPKRGQLLPEDVEFLEKIKVLAEEVKGNYQTFRVRRASQLIMDLAQLGNVYFDRKKPWKLVKEEGKQEELLTALALCLECLKVLALISNPIIPTASETLWKMLGNTTPIEKMEWQKTVEMPIPEGQKLGESVLLFQKVEEEAIQIEIAKLAAEKSATPQKTVKETPKAETTPKTVVSIEDFSKLDLRVGTVLAAEPVPKSSKLLKLELEEANGNKRTIVSGIAKHYTPEAMVGKKVVFVANLQPAKVMGIESQGMVLAGKSGDLLEVLSVHSLPSGSVVS